PDPDWDHAAGHGLAGRLLFGALQFGASGPRVGGHGPSPPGRDPRRRTALCCCPSATGGGHGTGPRGAARAVVCLCAFCGSLTRAVDPVARLCVDATLAQGSSEET